MSTISSIEDPKDLASPSESVINVANSSTPVPEREQSAFKELRNRPIPKSKIPQKTKPTLKPSTTDQHTDNPTSDDTGETPTFPPPNHSSTLNDAADLNELKNMLINLQKGQTTMQTDQAKNSRQISEKLSKLSKKVDAADCERKAFHERLISLENRITGSSNSANLQTGQACNTTLSSEHRQSVQPRVVPSTMEDAESEWFTGCISFEKYLISDQLLS